MGTYTTNYNLFLPSIGEQGWGELVNGNFEIIDNTMAGLNTRIGTLKTEADAVEERVIKLENGEFNGTVSAENFTGKINVPSVALNSGGVVLCKVTYEDVSISGKMSTSPLMATCPAANVEWFNTSIFNYTGEPVSETCTITITLTFNGATQSKHEAIGISVIDNNTNTAVVSQTIDRVLHQPSASRTYTYEFVRDITTSYTINLAYSTAYGANWTINLTTNTSDYEYCIA